MDLKERRSAIKENTAKLRQELNVEQLAAINTLEKFGWGILFVRRPLFQEKVVVVSDGEKVALLELDGEINENHGLVLRNHPIMGSVG